MLLARFFKDRTASVVPMLAVAIIPLLGAAGAAVDYGRAARVRSSVQSALDSTALMIAKEVQAAPAGTNWSAKAGTYFNALLNSPNLGTIPVSAVLSNLGAGSFKLSLSASTSVPTMIVGVLNLNNPNAPLPVNASSEVVWGIKKLELALVLDNTGSMASSSKMTELKKAAKNLLSTLEHSAKTPGDIKVAVIPFDTTVRIDPALKAQSWFDWSTMDCNGSQNGTGCGGHPQDYWTGCVMDRTQQHDVQDTPPNSNNSATLYPAVKCGSLAQALPLTSDWTKLASKIEEMTPAGNTNTTIGLVWGWHALTTGIPYAEAAAPANDLDKAIVVLTDGQNTKNRWTTSTSSIDSRTETVCNNIKAANIKIYTVRVVDGNATLLKNCATNHGMYYDVQDAAQLNSAFGEIAQNLATLRIAR
jgi:Flp pilus assembly protein TadG